VTDLTKLANGQPCQIRIAAICNGRPETSVWCHVRMIDISGSGMKAPDLLGAIGCSACHDIVDNRAASYAFTYEQRRLFLLEGVMRTQVWLLEQGIVLIRGEREPRPERLSKIVPRRTA